MATLIPALGACVSRMTPGEKCLTERLEKISAIAFGCSNPSPPAQFLRRAFAMSFSTGLYLSVVAVPGVGHMLAADDN